MKCFPTKSVMCTLLAMVVLSTTQVRADDKDPTVDEGKGWVKIFDGKTLKGWKPNEKPKNWTVEDGNIVGRGSRSHLFYMGSDFTNFEFKAEIMTQKGTNSGIYFHTKFQDSGWPEIGHESQVNVTHGDPVKTGSLYNIVKLYKTPAKDGQWWTQHIIVNGNHIVTKINGIKVIDFYEKTAEIKGGRKLSKGTFAFQQHDPGSVVRYRNIRVRRLPPTKK